MVYYVKVTKVVKNHRSYQVQWFLNGKPVQTCFYHHSDGSWGCDPAFKKLDANVQRYLQKRVKVCLTRKQRNERNE